MTYFEMFCIIGGLAAPIIVAIGYGIFYTIKDIRDKKEEK